MNHAGRGEVATALDSIVEFERWRDTRDKTLLDAIERYNEEDCVSTLRLRDWLLARKVEAETRFGAIPVETGSGQSQRAGQRSRGPQRAATPKSSVLD